MTLAFAPRGRWPLRHAWLRWTVSLILVVALHAVALLTLRRSVPTFGSAVPEAIMIDLAPAPAAPPEPPAPVPTPAVPTPVAPPDPVSPDPTPPDPVPPDPVPPDPAPEPPVLQEPVALPIPDMAPMIPQAAVQLPPRPVTPRQPPKPRPAAARPQAADPPAAAPAQTPAEAAVSAPTGQVQATWEALLVAHLARFKRFPPAAQRRGEQGVVLMRLSMTRAGAVLSMAMVRGSGYADLDEEAQAWMARAQPLPAAPPEMKAQQVEIVVPLRFTLR
jgi:periplasmic protein TonB